MASNLGHARRKIHYAQFNLKEVKYNLVKPLE